MYKKTILGISILLLLTSCVHIAVEDMPTPTGPQFVTATLPPTQQEPSVATSIPLTETPDASITTTPVETPLANGTTCKDSAVLMQDVTVPDNTLMTRGEMFTKTWRFANTGKCNWGGYTIAFSAGDRMDAPDTAPVPQTASGQTVDVSVELTAPSADGSYTGYFELRNANGQALAIGTEKTFWVKILIGIAAPTNVIVIATSPNNTPVSKPSGPKSCTYTTSASYQTEIANLINTARTQNGLPALAINAQLASAAQGHSIDMACHGLLSHTGSDGSSVNQRVVAAGYAPSYSEEIIYGSGFPQTAFDWWMNDKIHRDAILNPNISEMGVGYAYVADTAYGGYYTVDFGRP
ncbi:MAG: hypothetical protein IPP66_10955 [Anaerolineales bacterium]|nr:hypothetical protein [Anaerolineales bacterium]